MELRVWSYVRAWLLYSVEFLRSRCDGRQIYKRKKNKFRGFSNWGLKRIDHEVQKNSHTTSLLSFLKKTPIQLPFSFLKKTPVELLFSFFKNTPIQLLFSFLKKTLIRLLSFLKKYPKVLL